MTTCFALLDDHLADPAEARSRLYLDHLQTLSCNDAAAFPLLLQQMQQALAAGQHAVALWHYELGAALHDLPHRHPGGPLARVLLFGRCQRLGSDDAEQWLAARDDGQPAGVTQLTAGTSEADFHQAIDRIRDYIAAGHTYQVNYTTRLHFRTYGSSLALYRRLRQRQRVPYGALVQLEDGSAVLSFSPELFVSHSSGMLKAKPMKGTARALDDSHADAAASNAQRALALAADDKNRAENLMIVDLLRNDLGRIAVGGSVQVPHLFDVRRYGQVLQMTSTIRARLRQDVTLAQAIGALYPCGSITGAPKRRTMEIIHELEDSPRGLYTGAIGWFEAPREAGKADKTSQAGQAGQAGQTVGDFCLSVPIRTLVLEPPLQGQAAGVMGVGAGIVFDSQAASEYAECQLKAAFLTGLGHDFSLFETMHADATGCRHQARHLQRLQASAATFGFPFDGAAIQAQLQQACDGLSGPHRLRLALTASGECSISHAPLQALSGPVKVLLAPDATDSGDLFLRHKSTRRQRYDQAWQQAERQGGFDMLFFNEKDELTEGGRSNVFVKLDGRWVTPPLSAGVLPGVMRGVLLDDPQWNAIEAPITRAQLLAAPDVVICNALRGVLPAELLR